MAQTPTGLQAIGSLYDPQISVDQAQIERNMALAEALRKQALAPAGPTEMAGQLAVSRSPLEGLAKILGGYVANKQDEANDTARLALNARTMQAVASMLKDPSSGLTAPSGRSAQTTSSAVEGATSDGPSQPSVSQPQGQQSTPQSAAYSAPAPGLADLLRSQVVGTFSPQIAAAQAKNFETPEAIRTMQAQGLDPRTMGQLELAAKQAAALKGARPGETMTRTDANGNVSPVFYNPRVGEGVAPAWNANGQVTGSSAIPGYAGAAADIEYQKSLAQSAAGVHMVRTADGRELPTRVPAPGYGSPSNAPTAPAGARMPLQPPAPQPPGAQAPPQSPSKDPWATMPLRQVPSGMGQSTFDAQMAQKQADFANEVAKRLSDDANSANKRNAINSQITDLVDKSDTGPMAAHMADVKNWLVQRLGIDESNFQNTPSATTALNKNLMNAAIQRARDVFNNPRMTQQEVMTYLDKGAPNLDMTKSVIKFLVQSDNVMNGYSIKKAQDFGTYLNRGGDPMQFEGWHASAFPAANTLSTVQLNAGKQGAPQRGLVPNGDGSFTYRP